MDTKNVRESTSLADESRDDFVLCSAAADAIVH